MVYVALLRGINVGGKARVEMARLKTVFESTGCTNVTTYINSGNVVFNSPEESQALVPHLVAAICQEFGFAVPVVLRDLPSMQKLCAGIPANWANDSEYKTDVMFLWDEIDDASIVEKVLINPKIENVRYIHGALIWNIGRKDVTRGGGIKLIKTDLYKLMTVRNVNTVRKLCVLMEATN